MKYEEWKKYRDAEEAEMVDQAWKQWERAVCKAFGGERYWEVPEECKHTGVFAPEAKYRKKLPKWLEDMMVQAENQAHENQIPLVALTERYRKRDDAYVIIRFRDFLDWYVSGPATEDNEPIEDEDVHAGTSPLPGFEKLVD